MALAKLMRHKGRCFRAGIVDHLGKEDRSGLDAADVIQRVKRHHPGQPLAIFLGRFRGEPRAAASLPA